MDLYDYANKSPSILYVTYKADPIIKSENDWSRAFEIRCLPVYKSQKSWQFEMSLRAGNGSVL